jgi:serine/threonine protein kinase/lipopolysaccharide biosynthesis regulator YciM
MSAKEIVTTPPSQIICPNCDAHFFANNIDELKDLRCSNCKVIFQIGSPHHSTFIEVLKQEDAGETVALKHNPNENETTDEVYIKELDKDTPLIYQKVLSGDQLSLRSFLSKLEVSPNAELPQNGVVEKDISGSSRYIYGKEIGRGGMGAIISTRDLDTKRHLVTKTLLNKTSKKALLRFIEEAQITAQLEHPNIVPVYDIGVNKDNNVFYTMKHVKGLNLQELIKQYADKKNDSETKKQNQNHLIEILISVCNAVAFAHSKKVIHRDLKPENIMIGEYGEVILMDFGLAKILSKKNDEIEELGEPITSSRYESDQIISFHGEITGTPKYMSPEQAKGEIDQQDERTDIYALGAILFTCIVNLPPTPGGSIKEVIKNVIDGIRHPLPSNVASELVAIINKSMEINKEKRYQTVRELSDDLQLYLKGFSISAKEDHLGEIAIKLIKRNYPVFLSTLIFVFILIIFSVIAISRILKEKEDAISNLNKYKTAEKIVAEEKIKNTNLQKEKIKEWKSLYEEDFINLKYDLIPESTNDYAFGNWVVPNANKIIRPINFQNGLQSIDKKVWLTNGALHYSAPIEGYLYLNVEIFGNIRIDTTVELLKGNLSEITLFICGSKEKQELDGYTLVLCNTIKLQKKGKPAFEQELARPVQPNEKYQIRFERIGNIIRAFVNDFNTPAIQWEDSEPIYGEENTICGFYVWEHEIAIHKFMVTKEAWAKQNTPLDFVERIRKNGYDKLAIKEYKEIIFATDDIVQKTEALFEMGKTYKHAGMTTEATRVFNSIIQNNEGKSTGNRMDALLKKSYVFLFLIELDASFEQLDSALNEWPPTLKQYFERIITKCKNDSSLEMVFNYLITKVVPKASNKESHLKAIKLINILLEAMDNETEVLCKNSYAEFLCNISNNYLKPGDFLFAEKLLTLAIKVKNNSDRAYQLRGYLRTFQMNDESKVEDGLKDSALAMKINPGNIYPCFHLSTYYMNKNENEKAISVLKIALKNSPNSITLLKRLLENELEINQFDDFESVKSKLESLSPNDPSTNFLTGLYCYKTNKTDLLESLLSKTQKKTVLPK